MSKMNYRKQVNVNEATKQYTEQREKEFLKYLGDYYFSIRFKSNLNFQLLNSNYKKYLSFHLEGLDFSCTKPSSAFSIKSTFLLRSIKFYNCLTITNKPQPIKHKKKGIFATLFGLGGSSLQSPLKNNNINEVDEIESRDLVLTYSKLKL